MALDFDRQGNLGCLIGISRATMLEMSSRRRLRASWLFLVFFTSMSLGVCAGLSDAGGKLPCCEGLPGQGASLTACCSTGQPSSTSDLPIGIQALPRPAWEIAFEVTPQVSPDHLSRRHSPFVVPYASADPQALLSTFLI